jgi:diadenylate cyclase
VLEHSRSLILDPIAHHPKELRSIRNSNLRGTLKELAQLDGAFIFDDSSVLVAGCRYLDAKRPISSYEWDLAVVISQARQFPR